MKKLPKIVFQFRRKENKEYKIKNTRKASPGKNLMKKELITNVTRQSISFMQIY